MFSLLKYHDTGSVTLDLQRDIERAANGDGPNVFQVVRADLEERRKRNIIVDIHMHMLHRSVQAAFCKVEGVHRIV